MVQAGSGRLAVSKELEGGGAVTGADGGPGHPVAGDTVTQLRAVVLPAGLPVLPQARVAAQYVPAPRDQAECGAWFDAPMLPGGVVALMAGTVTGGEVAAVAVVQLRAVLTELLATVPDLAAVLARADEFTARTPALTAATLAVALLDPASGTLRYAVRGHPAPLIAAADGSAWFPPGGRSGPLGTGSVPSAAGTVLEPGEMVVLYSGGPTWLPGRTPAEAMSDLAAVAADAAANRTLPADPAATAPDRVCQQAANLLAHSGSADDVAVLAAQRLAIPVSRLSLDLPADRASLREARRGFGEWLAEGAPLAAGQDALWLAVGELVSNAIEHAYPPGSGGRVGIDAGITPEGLLECRVTDRGRWREPGPEEDRGNGLMLAASMADDLTVTHPPQSAAEPPGSRGTVATLRHRLLRPPQLGPAPGARAAAGPGPPLRVGIPAAGHAVVTGAADSAAVERLAGRLLAACRGGTITLAVDLTGLTRLSGAGIRVLFQVRDQLAAHGQDLNLVAEPGSPASAALDLARLPYTGDGTAGQRPFRPGAGTRGQRR